MIFFSLIDRGSIDRSRLIGSGTTSMSLQPFSLTHVEYIPGDALGWLASLASLAPVFWLAVAAATLVQRRDLGCAAYLCGQLANEVLNWLLKRALAQPRPAAAAVHLHAGPVYGMPSNHAQFAGFFAASACAWAASGRGCGGARARAAAAAAAALAAAAAVGASRVYLHYHSVEQVVAGWAVGAAAGTAWAALVDGALRPHFARLAATPLARTCGVRDASVVDVLRIEYEAVVAAAAAAARRGGARARAE